jgi:hypothetical protein
MGSHTHSGTTGGGGTHAHGSQFGGNFVIVTAGSVGFQLGGGGQTVTEYTLTSTAPDHTHSFGTGGPSTNTTDNNNQGHTHGIPALGHAGASGAASGAVAATNANMPPYAVVNMIVRVH